MTRQYWTNHNRFNDLIMDNRHIALLIIRNFEQAEIRPEAHEPYRRWKQWIKENPIRKQRD